MDPRKNCQGLEGLRRDRPGRHIQVVDPDTSGIRRSGGCRCHHLPPQLQLNGDKTRQDTQVVRPHPTPEITRESSDEEDLPVAQSPRQPGWTLRVEPAAGHTPCYGMRQPAGDAWPATCGTTGAREQDGLPWLNRARAVKGAGS